MKSVEQILEIKYRINGLKIDDVFYRVDYFEDYNKTFYVYDIDCGCKIDYEFTVEELSNREDIIFYEYKEV